MSQSAKYYIDFVFDEVASLKTLGLDKKTYSDTVDAQGHQYIDLVLEGGGILGVALLGYIYILEQAGIRFLGLGGNSAGSITALVTAAIDEPEKPKAERLTAILANMPMDTFIDGDSDARKFVQAMLSRDTGLIRKFFTGVQVIDNVYNDLGLNPGDVFKQWVTDTLEGFGIKSVAALRQRMATLPAGGLHRRGSSEPIEFPADGNNLCLITADISTETRVELPRMAKLYWRDPEQLHPAEFARASMSIPLFFQPYIIKNADVLRGPEQKQLWRDLAGFSEQGVEDRVAPGDWLPYQFVFVDGGVMSNFPIDAFHKNGQAPRRPTFGVKLQWDDRCHQITKPETLVAQLLNSARHTLDYEFIRRNPDYQHLVSFIDTADHDWLNFELTDEKKLDLFKRGAKTGLNFLKDFNWEGYKKIREGLASAQVASDVLWQDRQKQQ